MDGLQHSTYVVSSCFLAGPFVNVTAVHAFVVNDVIHNAIGVDFALLR